MKIILLWLALNAQNGEVLDAKPIQYFPSEQACIEAQLLTPLAVAKHGTIEAYVCIVERDKELST